MAVAAGAAVVALSYALYALLREPFEPAGASALTAVAMALVALVIGLLFFGRAKPRHRDEAEDAGPVAALQQRALSLARAQPLIAIVAGLAGAYVLFRKPSLIALIGSTLLGMRTQKKKDQRRGLI